MFTSIEQTRKNITQSRLLTSDIYRKWLVVNVILFWYASLIPVYNYRNGSDFPNLHLIFFSYVILTFPVFYILAKLESDFDIANYLIKTQTILLILSALIGFMVLLTNTSSESVFLEVISIPGWSAGLIIMGFFFVLTGIIQIDFWISLLISIIVVSIYLLVLLAATLLYFEINTSRKEIGSHSAV